MQVCFVLHGYKCFVRNEKHAVNVLVNKPKNKNKNKPHTHKKKPHTDCVYHVSVPHKIELSEIQNKELPPFFF